MAMREDLVLRGGWSGGVVVRGVSRSRMERRSATTAARCSSALPVAAGGVPAHERRVGQEEQRRADDLGGVRTRGCPPRRRSTSAESWPLCCSIQARWRASRRGSLAASSKARASRVPADRCGSLRNEVDERLEVGEQVPGGSAGRELLGGRRVERPRGVAEHGVVLRLEVVEERAGGDAGLVADGLDRDGVEAVLGDEAVGRVDQRLAPRALLALTQPEGGLVDQ